MFNLVCGALALLAFTCLPALTQQESEKQGAGVVISGKASSSDVGLPIYPHSTPHKDGSNESQSARLGLWGWRLGIQTFGSEDGLF